MSKTMMLVAALTVVLVAGCGKKTTYQTKDGEVKVDERKGEVTFESKSGKGSVKVAAGAGEVALPDKFPKDVPIQKGGAIRMSATQDKTMTVQYVTSGSQAEALKFYQDQLKEQGWEIESTMNMGDSSMVAAKKGKRKCMAMVVKDSKETMVSLTVTDE